MTTTPVRLSARPRAVEPLSVALIRPPMVVQPSSLSTHGPVPPIGLAYITAVVSSAGHEVSVIDAVALAMDHAEEFDTPSGVMRRVGLSPAQTVEQIRGTPDVIGVSLMFVHEWPQAREVVNLARVAFPESVIVVGGETATSFWPWMFEETDAIDYVVRGEGEATFVELLDRVAGGAAVDGLEGVVANARSAIAARAGTLPVRLRRLDEVPRPDWTKFDLDPYLEHPYFGVNRGRSMPVLATRGCPYRCSFCSSPQMWTTRYVVREPDDVVDEIASYVERYQARNVNFC